MYDVILIPRKIQTKRYDEIRRKLTAIVCLWQNKFVI